jgi:hypothetical protein
MNLLQDSNLPYVMTCWQNSISGLSPGCDLPVVTRCTRPTIAKRPDLQKTLMLTGSQISFSVQ